MKAKTKGAAAASNAGERAQRIILIVIAVLALVGVAETVYLTALHLAGAHVVCLAAANCSQVLSSPYAAINGFPLAAVGAIGYFSVFSLSTLALFRFPRATLFLALAIVAMFLATLWLLYVQAFVLKAFCDYCLFSAAIVFLLTGLLIAMPPKRAA
jgi:uncharacterized membrane protein